MTCPKLAELEAKRKDDPQNQTNISRAKELEEFIKLLREELGHDVTEEETAKESTQPNPPPNNHGKPDSVQKPIVYNLKDKVLAKWSSGDRGFYPAVVTSISGSSVHPQYVVRFDIDGTMETISDLAKLKPHPVENKKRKADTLSDETSKIPGVISAPANIDPNLASKARKDAATANDASHQFKKSHRQIQPNKQLEGNKANWQKFQKHGKTPKAGKKESQFRTGDGFNARGESPSSETFDKIT